MHFLCLSVLLAIKVLVLSPMPIEQTSKANWSEKPVSKKDFSSKWTLARKIGSFGRSLTVILSLFVKDFKFNFLFF